MNIELNYEELSSLKNKLNDDNIKINELTIEIIKKIKGLDESKWSSSEKKKLDEQLIPFISEVETNMFSRLDECVNLIGVALDKYKKTEDSIKKNVTSVTDSDNVSENVKRLNSGEKNANIYREMNMGNYQTDIYKTNSSEYTAKNIEMNKVNNVEVSLLKSTTDGIKNSKDYGNLFDEVELYKIDK